MYFADADVELEEGPNQLDVFESSLSHNAGLRIIKKFRTLL